MIPPSELILNSDGSIYHLNLKKEDVADTIIVVGDPRRVSSVSQFFDRIEIVKEKREFLTHTGYLGSQRISVISTGMGAGNIDIFMNEIDAVVNIDLDKRIEKENKKSLSIIRFGTSGSIHPQIQPGDYVVSAMAFGFDSAIRFYGANENAAFTEYLHQNGVKDVTHYFSKASNKLLSTISNNFQQGVTLTMPGFYAAQNRSLRIPYAVDLDFDQMHKFELEGVPITNIEMETSCIYWLAEHLGHQAVSLNCILANRLNKSFSDDPGKEIKKMIQHGLHWITENL